MSHAQSSPIKRLYLAKGLTLFLFVLIILMSLFEAFDGFYLLHVAKGEIQILLNRISLQDAIGNQHFSVEERNKLNEIHDILNYAAGKLHLNVGSKYRTVTTFNVPIVALSASKKDAFLPYQWYFPIVGEIPYKGFFGINHARRDLNNLNNQDYDTLLRPVSAFSTLGWFDDPVLPGFLKYSKESICRTILHELTHATVYFPGKTDFNENIATFVGLEGSLEYFRETSTPSGDEVNKIMEYNRAKKDFTIIINQIYTELANLYARDIPSSQKMKLRDTIFQKTKEKYLTRLRSENRRILMSYLKNLEMNNAQILSYRRYERNLGVLYRLLANEKDLAGCIKFFKTIPPETEAPLCFIENFVKKVDKRGENVLQQEAGYFDNVHRQSGEISE